MSQSSKNKKRMNAFFKKKGKKRCIYCKRVVHRSTRRSGALDPTTATIDHKYSRLDIRRLLVTEKENTVLCCNECNDRRNETERLMINMFYSNLNPISSVMTNVGIEIMPDMRLAKIDCRL